MGFYHTTNKSRSNRIFNYRITETRSFALIRFSFAINSFPASENVSLNRSFHDAQRDFDQIAD